MPNQLPSYNEIIHLIIADEPPSYEKAIGIEENFEVVSCTFYNIHQKHKNLIMN